uniref:Uncharacterized protein n=1 Tax=Anguilla anguilla TaxID=7936 RepID=A0A0E9WWE8_ANGAN
MSVGCYLSPLQWNVGFINSHVPEHSVACCLSVKALVSYALCTR